MCSNIFMSYIQAGYPLLWVETHEEYRALTALSNEISNFNTKNKSGKRYAVYTWDCVDGVKKTQIKDGIVKSTTIKQDDMEIDDPFAALEWAEKAMEDDSILMLKDFHPFAKKNGINRKIRNLVPAFKSVGKVLAIISHAVEIPSEIEKEITVIRFKLPDFEELKIVLKSLCESAGSKYPTDDEPIIKAALGMTSFEAENAFAVSLVEKKEFDQDVIRREKAAIVRKTGLLEVVDTNQKLEDIGGLEDLKAWLKDREDCFTDEARKFGILPPKGLLLLGVPGCGKSLTAKAVATAWHRPLLRLEMGKVFGSYVGESESKIRSVLSIAEAVAPCVLFVDELEKALAGSNGSNDSGVTRRVLGTFLTWLSDKTADVFLVATANKVDMLPPELLRSGRFDALFWVDLPTEEERVSIANIHLERKDRHFTPKQLGVIAKCTEGFSGAEIETLIGESLVRAFSQKKELSENLIGNMVKEITPISKLMQSDIQASRQWAKDRGVRRAGGRELEAVAKGPKARKISLN